MTLRTIDDLPQLHADALDACLAGLRDAILDSRQRYAAALNAGLLSRGSEFSFSSFTWLPAGDRRTKKRGPVGPATPIDDLELRTRAVLGLKELHVFCVEDLSAISEEELQAQDAIGTQAMRVLREALAQTGLAFLPSLDQSRSVLALPGEVRQQVLRTLDDAAPASALGLRSRTLGRATAQGCETLGALRRLSLDQLCDGFGKLQAREIYHLLEATGQPFASAATAPERWRRGLADVAQLELPTAPETPIAELRPWLGATTRLLAARGIHELGSLREAARRTRFAADMRISSVTAERLRDFLRTSAAG